MDTKIIITALLVIVVLAFVLIFRKNAAIRINAFGAKVKLNGTNESPPAVGIKAEDLQAGENIKAHEKGGQGIDAKRLKAKRSITLTNEPPPGDPNSPKP